MRSAKKVPKQARARATVEAILEATAQLLAEGGYDALSTNKIAVRAGVSIGSLYQYFDGKESLVSALIETRIMRQRGRLLEALPQLVDLPLRKGIVTLIMLLMRTHRDDLELNRTIFAQIPNVQLFSFVDEMERSTVTVLVPYLEMRREEIRPHDLELATYLCVRTFTSAIQGALGSRPDLLREDRMERFANEIADLVSRYLLLEF